MSEGIEVGNPSAGPAEPDRRILVREGRRLDSVESRKPRLILLFTADAGVQERLEEAILGSSAVVLVASNLREALEIILTKGRALDCAIVDIDQECGGITLLGGIEGCRDPGLVIVIAANPGHAWLVRGRDKAMRFFKKPLPAEVLAAALTYPPKRPPPSRAA